jgi:hypothetical protein
MRSTGWQTAHAPDQQVSPAAHALPQLPQLFGSVCSFTQTLPHRAAPPPHPASPPEELPDEPPLDASSELSLPEQLPPLQVIPPVQANVDPHPPQLLLSVCSLTHAPLHAL